MDLDPDPSVRGTGTDPGIRIRIRTEMSQIPTLVKIQGSGSRLESPNLGTGNRTKCINIKKLLPNP